MTTDTGSQAGCQRPSLRRPSVVAPVISRFVPYCRVKTESVRRQPVTLHYRPCLLLPKYSCLGIGFISPSNKHFDNYHDRFGAVPLFSHRRPTPATPPPPTIRPRFHPIIIITIIYCDGVCVPTVRRQRTTTTYIGYECYDDLLRPLSRHV